MAEVYRQVNGRGLAEIIAYTVESRDGVDDHALKAAGRAEARLAGHKHDGHARIDIEHGDVDAYVVLDDERGLAAALSIEFGRPKKGDMKPTRILRGAFRGLK